MADKNSSSEQKDFMTTAMLSLFVGWLGVDRFYLGHTKLGVIKLVTIGGFGVWYIIDLILILTGSMKDASGGKLKNRDKNLKTAVIIVVAFFAFSLIVSAIGSATETSQENKSDDSSQTNNSSNEVEQEPAPEPEKKAEFEGEITGYEAVNPASLRFTANVQNTGNGDGTFDCFVSAQDPSGTYKGFDSFSSEDAIQPGKSKAFAGVLTITKEGSIYVTDVTIDCSE